MKLICWAIETNQEVHVNAVAAMRGDDCLDCVELPRVVGYEIRHRACLKQTSALRGSVGRQRKVDSSICRKHYTISIGLPGINTRQTAGTGDIGALTPGLQMTSH